MLRRFFLLGTLLFATTSCSSLLYYPHSRPYILKEKLPFVPEDVSFNSEDGTKLHGWWIQRSDKSKAAKATVLHFHGNAQNLTTHFAALEWIREHGFDYFIFDYRGYGQSEGRPSPEGTVKDGHAALRWVKQKSPTTPIIVVGQSLGGAVALRSVADLKNEVPVALMVADSTFHSYQEISRKFLAKSWLTWLLQPMAYVVMSDRWAPGEKIAEISPTKVLVVHGVKDPVIPFSLGKRVFALAKEPREMWEIPEGRHIDFTWRIQEGYRQKLIEEFEKALSK